MEVATAPAVVVVIVVDTVVNAASDGVMLIITVDVVVPIVLVTVPVLITEVVEGFGVTVDLTIVEMRLVKARIETVFFTVMVEEGPEV